MKYICAGIDGTGSREWRREDGFNSHVFRFCRDFRADYSTYWNGPGLAGTELDDIVQGVTRQIDQKISEFVRGGVSRGDIRICLVGHSRGAVAAMWVARVLSRSSQQPMRIKFMGLYDAVDRSALPDLNMALRNVENLRHAVRQNQDWFGGSRASFGSVDVDRGQTQAFDTSHGGLGGDAGFFNSLLGSTDTYCNSLEIVLTDAELLRRFRHDYSGQPRFTQLTGRARDQRIRELRTRWQASWDADRWIREGAAAACGAHRLAATSPHIPFREENKQFAAQLAQALGLASLAH